MIAKLRPAFQRRQRIDFPFVKFHTPRRHRKSRIDKHEQLHAIPPIRRHRHSLIVGIIGRDLGRPVQSIPIPLDIRQPQRRIRNTLIQNLLRRPRLLRPGIRLRHQLQRLLRRPDRRIERLIRLPNIPRLQQRPGHPTQNLAPKGRSRLQTPRGGIGLRALQGPVAIGRGTLVGPRHHERGGAIAVKGGEGLVSGGVVHLESVRVDSDGFGVAEDGFAVGAVDVEGSSVVAEVGDALAFGVGFVVFVGEGVWVVGGTGGSGVESVKCFFSFVGGVDGGRLGVEVVDGGGGGRLGFAMFGFLGGWFGVGVGVVVVARLSFGAYGEVLAQVFVVVFHGRGFFGAFGAHFEFVFPGGVGEVFVFHVHGRGRMVVMVGGRCHWNAVVSSVHRRSPRRRRRRRRRRVSHPLLLLRLGIILIGGGVAPLEIHSKDGLVDVVVGFGRLGMGRRGSVGGSVVDVFRHVLGRHGHGVMIGIGRVVIVVMLFPVRLGSAFVLRVFEMSLDVVEIGAVVGVVVIHSEHAAFVIVGGGRCRFVLSGPLEEGIVVVVIGGGHGRGGDGYVVFVVVVVMSNASVQSLSRCQSQRGIGNQRGENVRKTRIEGDGAREKHHRADPPPRRRRRRRRGTSIGMIGSENAMCHILGANVMLQRPEGGETSLGFSGGAGSVDYVGWDVVSGGIRWIGGGQKGEGGGESESSNGD
mmetsp:Transcript_5234/g.10915  ORF Transcript_5234/g.10915 Transcript_5234/m.10915 type:complete len:694 (+) Transcript_5234:1765-3846(+)